MKFCIFGATGKVGRHIVEQALNLGHHVTAFTRNPQQLKKSHPNLKVVQGDVLDIEAVKTAIKGNECVLVALGMPIFNKENLRSKGTKNIVQAMEEIGIKRLICLSSHGVGDSWKSLPALYKYLIVPLAFKRLFADHALQETYIKNSSLDWTIGRSVNFTEGTLTKEYHHGFDKPKTLKISHQDVADFLINQISTNAYLRQTPSLSY